MPRYPHYLRSAKGNLWPLRIYLVDCKSKTEYQYTNKGIAIDTLDSWHCYRYDLFETGYGIHSTTTGITTKYWWEWIRLQLVSTKSSWIMSEQCTRVWPLLGVWQMIESQQLQIVGTDPYDSENCKQRINDIRNTQEDRLAPISSGQLNRSKAKRHGMLVVADPPCVLSGRLRDTPTRFTWVDSRNYGVKLPDGIYHGSPVCEWLARFWLYYHGLCKLANLGSAQTTTGSQAFHGWRVGYHAGGVYVDPRQEITDLETRSYYGGRCECFRIGEIRGPVYHLDIRSAYGAKCVSESVPMRIKHIHRNPGLYDMAERIYSGYCIASVSLSTVDPCYPYRRESDVIYPSGQFNTVLAGPELRDAYDTGCVLQIYQLLEYEAKPILRDYAQLIYDFRCMYEDEGNVEMATVCKALLVSIVGKFAQKDHRWVHCHDIWSDIQYGEWHGQDSVGRGCRYRSLGGVVQRDELLGLASEAVPAVASWILSAARMLLLDHITFAGWDNVYYCDTDSLMVNEVGYGKLCQANRVTERELGKLYVHGVYSNVKILGIKHYISDGKVVCSGLPAGRCTDAGDGLHYWYTVHPGESTANGKRPESTRVLRKYQRQSEYTHGQVCRDGTVRPIVLEG